VGIGAYMISCKDVREPASGSQREYMVLERTNYEVGSMGVGAGLYMYAVVVKSPRSLYHQLMSSRYDDVSGCFYAFVNKIELSRIRCFILTLPWSNSKVKVIGQSSRS